MLFSIATARWLCAKAAANKATSIDMMIIKMMFSSMGFASDNQQSIADTGVVEGGAKEAFHAQLQELVVQTMGPDGGDLWKTFDTRYIIDIAANFTMLHDVLLSAQGAVWQTAAVEQQQSSASAVTDLR